MRPRSLALVSLIAGAAAVSIAVGAPVRAQGCGPTRLKVSESVVLDVPPARAWALVGHFQDMSWDADVVSASGSGDETVGAVRTLRLASGGTVSESLFKLDAATMTYATHVDRLPLEQLPVQNASLTLSVASEAGGTRSRVTWRGAFYRLLREGETSPDAADAEASRAMASFLRSGLGSVRSKLDASPFPRT